MAEKGRQTPTRSYILPYEKSEGQNGLLYVYANSQSLLLKRA